MANVDSPTGLRSLGRTNDGGFPRLTPYPKDASATVVYAHDVVTLEADGGLAAGGTPGTTLFRGVALHFRAGSTADIVGVEDSPGSDGASPARLRAVLSKPYRPAQTLVSATETSI